jgi:phosphatidylglycerophosphatase A
MQKLGLRCSHPAVLLATWFGCGLLPWVPGTWGSLAALPLAWLIVYFSGTAGLLIAAAIVFAVGCWASNIVEHSSGTKDARFIVIDEVAGQFLALAPAPLMPLPYIAGFLLFRFFDITKPFPIRWIERNFPGGFGVMADDIGAAIYAALVLAAGEYVLAH